ncbi:MAG: glycosyltransferase family 2 protein [Planctomycetes bacterium]|nr:glycosyltransferase family 2 protein [Planctomycetota bacterium]
MKGSDFSCAVVIVAYNSENCIEPCLESVFTGAGRRAAVVVDNSPGEATAAAVARFQADHPDREVTLIRRPDNIGFAAGCNLGARGRDEDYLLFLNPDTTLEPEALDRLVAFLRDNPPAWLAGPQIRDEAGLVVRTCRALPTPFRIFLDATGLDRLVGRYRLLRFDHQSARPVEQIIGACILIRRARFEALGGFDERFFIYFEEVDLCRRVLAAGGEVWFRPEAGVRHRGGASCEVAATLSRSPGYLRRSRAQYFAKWFGLLPQHLVSGITLAECVGKFLVLSVLALAGSPERRARRDGFLAVLRQWQAD